MKFRCLALAVLLSAPRLFAEEPAPSPAPAPVDSVILRSGLWKTTPADLAEDLKRLRFEWTSAAQDTARTAVPGLTFGGLPATEVLLRFRSGVLSGVTLLYFSRGDAGDIYESAFEKLLAEATAQLTAATGVQPAERGRDATSAVRAEGRTWTTADAQYLLEWSVTKESRARGIPFRAEFIRLTIEPPGTVQAAIGAVPSANSSRAAVKQFVGRDHVEKTATAAKLKDVPMVDQGQKGYCVVASVERVMRYYGADVDQHELAQVANTQTEGGTSPDAMLDSMKRLTARLGVKIKAVVDWNVQDFLKTVGDYNRLAKRGKQAPEVTGQYRTLDDYFTRMKPEIYKEARMKQSADFGKFRREIQRSIDEGIPLLWSVRLGLVPEKELNPQTAGGHMRLITGYDNATEEILYSDSWGAGHEEKRMAADDAWTITNSLFVLQPIGT